LLAGAAGAAAALAVRPLAARSAPGSRSDLGVAATTGFDGTYRGTVVANVDPDRLGRVQVTVPSVLGDVAVWALPSLPYAGDQVGLLLTPPVGASVWVEFEQGDPNMPIFAGCFYNAGEAPPTSAPDQRLLKTKLTAIQLDDGSEGSISVSAASVRLDGAVSFSRSGRAAVAQGEDRKTVKAVVLSTSTLVLVTLQKNVQGVSLQGVELHPAAGSFTVFLTQPAPVRLPFGWFAIG